VQRREHESCRLQRCPHWPIKQCRCDVLACLRLCLCAYSRAGVRVPSLAAHRRTVAARMSRARVSRARSGACRTGGNLWLLNIWPLYKIPTQHDLPASGTAILCKLCRPVVPSKSRRVISACATSWNRPASDWSSDCTYESTVEYKYQWSTENGESLAEMLRVNDRCNERSEAGVSVLAASRRRC
jgi:hypothetical protein